MKKFIVMAILIALIGFSYSAQAQKSKSKSKKEVMVTEAPESPLVKWRDAEPSDPAQIARDKAWDDKQKSLQAKKEKQLKAEELKASKNAAKKLNNKLVLDSLTQLAQTVSSLKSELIIGLSNTNLREGADKAKLEQDIRKTKNEVDSLTNLMIQCQKNIEGIISDSVNQRKNIIATFQVPGQVENYQTTILNASDEQIGQAVADRFRNDSVFAFQLAKAINGEAGKDGLSLSSQNGKAGEVGKNGSLTDGQLNQLKDFLVKQGLIGLIAKASNEQIGQAVADRFRNDSVFAFQLAKAINGEAGKDGLSLSGQNGKAGEEGLVGSPGPKGEQGPQGQVGPQGLQGERGSAGAVDLASVKNMIDQYLGGKNYVTAKDVQNSINQYLEQDDAKNASANTSALNTLEYKNGVDGKDGYNVVEKDREMNQAGLRRDPSVRRKIPSSPTSSFVQNSIEPEKLKTKQAPRRIIVRIIHDD